MKILVTGGAGFIGSHLCERLLKKGDEVFCLDNFITSHERNIVNLLKEKKFHFLKHDVIKSLPKELSSIKIEAIFFLASPASPNPESPLSYLNHPEETLLANSLGTYNYLKLARENKAKFLYVSTSEIYGDPQVTPQSETYWGNVNSLGLRSCYDESKRFGESMTMVFIRKYQLDARIIRIFNTFGPRMDKNDGRMIVNFVNRALENEPIEIYGKGNFTRSFCYIDDTVEGLILAMFKSKTKGEAFNIGNPEEHTVLEMAEMIKKITGSHSKIVFKKPLLDDPTNRCPDISKAKRILDWQPKVPLKEGLLKIIDYFKSG